MTHPTWQHAPHSQQQQPRIALRIQPPPNGPALIPGTSLQVCIKCVNNFNFNNQEGMVVLGGQCHCDTSKGYGYSLQPAGPFSSFFDYCVKCSGDNKVSGAPWAVKPQDSTSAWPSWSPCDCPATNVLDSQCRPHIVRRLCSSLFSPEPPLSADSLSFSVWHEQWCAAGYHS